MAGLAAAACVALTGCGHGEPAAAATANPPDAGISGSDSIRIPASSPKYARLRIEAVEDLAFPDGEITAPGKVEVNPNRVVRILMPVAGKIAAVHVRLGDAVEAGQPLVEIDSPDANAVVAAHSQAQSQTRQAEATLKKATADLERLRDLHEHKAAALKDVLSAENDLVQAQSALEQARSATESAQDRVRMLGLKSLQQAQQVSVRSPMSGKVLEMAVAPGEFRSDTATPLMLIADLRTVWMSADVPEAQIRKVEVGESVEVDLTAYPGEVFRATVARIADAVDPVSRTIKVRAEIQNPRGRLLPEMFGQIRHFHGQKMLPAVPAQAILQREGSSFVLVEESSGVFRETPVTPGPRLGEWVAAASGLKRGDRVVVEGALLLRKD